MVSLSQVISTIMRSYGLLQGEFLISAQNPGILPNQTCTSVPTYMYARISLREGVLILALVWCIYALPLEFATMCHSIGK